MKKEFYKLVIVFIMIVFSFSLAFFLGKEVILSGPYKEGAYPDIDSQNKGTLKLSKDHLISREEERGGQRKKIEEYRKKLITEELAKPVAEPTTEGELAESATESTTESTTESAKPNEVGTKAIESTDSENKKPTPKKAIEKPKPLEIEEAPVTKSLYGLLIDKYDEKEPAMEKSTKFKLRFPNLKIFFKKSKDMYKVYIGPFSSKKNAEDFLKKWKEKPDAPPVFVEKI